MAADHSWKTRRPWDEVGCAAHIHHDITFQENDVTFPYSAVLDFVLVDTKICKRKLEKVLKPITEREKFKIGLTCLSAVKT